MTVPNPRPFAGTPEVWRLNVDHDVTILARYLKGRQWRENKLAAVTDAASRSAATRAVLDRSDPAIADDLADYPGTFGAEKTARLIEPLGAWLGDMLVTHLDGEWVPRKRTLETQVVVGGRAFLPFQRAHNYFQSAGRRAHALAESILRRGAARC